MRARGLACATTHFVLSLACAFAVTYLSARIIVRPAAGPPVARAVQTPC